MEPPSQSPQKSQSVTTPSAEGTDVTQRTQQSTPPTTPSRTHDLSQQMLRFSHSSPKQATPPLFSVPSHPISLPRPQNKTTGELMLDIVGYDRLKTTVEEAKGMMTQLEREKAEWTEERKTHLSTIQSLQREKEQIQHENERLRGESETRLIEMQRTMEGMKNQLDTCTRCIEANNPIVEFSPEHIRVNGSTVTRINSESHVGCFTKPVSRGIHRMSITTEMRYVTIGVIDADEYPKFFAVDVDSSPKAAMMYKDGGSLWSAGKKVAQNTKLEKGQEWSVEADLEKRTVHFFIDGKQQPHHFINIPVPLRFVINAYNKDVPIEITFWGEVAKSHVTIEGTGHNLG
ncbi:hypothetical protein BLNAU_4823 [Blattamonas nauphoetae]|uniref:SPRY domain-containing protein n=1 Tax=Blattamonas nauphoetae TaxID=2049346 RepID=A0ABQ9Y965_9EUKA|nr:hypothetical protein BLNAU_4823 [Blattamonas nauphoetae]